MPIRFLDMFAGIGGFRSGLERLGGFECVGYCEIDKYAKQAYDAIYPTEGEIYFADARTIDPYTLPDIDLICGGFPCQSFSIAGLRRGFQDDTRGTLFFELSRILEAKHPAYFIFENVPPIRTICEGRVFTAILSELSRLGYLCEWQCIDGAAYLPQTRKRVFLVGYLDPRCAGEILSFTNANAASLIQLLGGTEGNRVYSDEGVGITLTSNAGGFGGKTGLYDVALPIKVDTKSGFQLAHPGDSIDLAYPTMNTRRGRVGEKIAHTVTPGNTQGYFFIDMNADPQLTETARCITARQDSGISKHKGEHSAVFIEDEPRAVVTPDKKTIRQQGRWIKEPNEPMFTLTVQDRHGILRYGRVRKLTPRECWRLQGFTDEQFDKAKAAGLSDGRLYKMAGNAVSVPVVSAVGAVIKRIYQEQIQKG